MTGIGGAQGLPNVRRSCHDGPAFIVRAQQPVLWIGFFMPRPLRYSETARHASARILPGVASALYADTQDTTTLSPAGPLGTGLFHALI